MYDNRKSIFTPIDHKILDLCGQGKTFVSLEINAPYSDLCGRLGRLQNLGLLRLQHDADKHSRYYTVKTVAQWEADLAASLDELDTAKEEWVWSH